MNQVEYMDARQCDYFNRFLAMKTGAKDYKRDTVIVSATVIVGDYTVDFNLVNGDDRSGPYLDVVLFDGADEVSALPAFAERIEGVYKLNDPESQRDIIVEIRRKS